MYDIVSRGSGRALDRSGAMRPPMEPKSGMRYKGASFPPGGAGGRSYEVGIA